VVALWLEMRELAAQELGLALGVVHDFCVAGQLDGGVVAGWDSVLVWSASLGAPRRRDVGVVVDDAHHHGWPRLDRRPDLVGPGQMDQEGVAVYGEVGGDNVRGAVAWVADGELPEIVPG